MFEHLDYLKDEVDLEAQNIEGTRFYRVPSGSCILQSPLLPVSMDARSLSTGVRKLEMKSRQNYSDCYCSWN